jgi:hypothetical protein
MVARLVMKFGEMVCYSTYVTVNFEFFNASTDPLNLRASNLGLILSWDESYDSSGNQEFEIDMGLGNGVGTIKEAEFAIAGLEAGRRYEFGVTAFDKAGCRSSIIVTQYPALGISFK